MREMAEHRAMSSLPVAAVHEDDDRRTAFHTGPEKVERLAFRRAIGDIEIGMGMRRPKRRSFARPTFRDGWILRHLGAVVVLCLKIHVPHPIAIYLSGAGYAGRHWPAKAMFCIEVRS